MKLQRFNEYSNDTEHESVVSFNDNEIKYLKSKSNLRIEQGLYFVNYKQVHKLLSGEYNVINDNIKCSTIQSLIKYTNNAIKPIIQYLESIFNNIEIINNTYYFNNKIIAKNPDDNFIVFNVDIIDMLYSSYNLVLSESKELIYDIFCKDMGYNPDEYGYSFSYMK